MVVLLAQGTEEVVGDGKVERCLDGWNDAATRTVDRGLDSERMEEGEV